MWPLLPKKCDCVVTNTNEGSSCDPSLLTTDAFVYMGIDLTCTGILHGDTVTIMLQKLEQFFCSDMLTQQFLDELTNNLEQYASFIALLNSIISCTTVLDCLNISTTTTTTTI